MHHMLINISTINVESNMFIPRVKVVIRDPSHDPEYYLGSTHIYLPSEVFFGGKRRMYPSMLISDLIPIQLRFGSIYHYSEKLFAQRFLGKDPDT